MDFPCNQPLQPKLMHSWLILNQVPFRAPGPDNAYVSFILHLKIANTEEESNFLKSTTKVENNHLGILVGIQ